MSVVNPEKSVAPCNSLMVSEIMSFRDRVKVGDFISAVIHIREWTSTTSFNLIPKLKVVHILKKYSNLVETDYGIMTWKDLAFGFVRMVSEEELEQQEENGESEEDPVSVPENAA